MFGEDRESARSIFFGRAKPRKHFGRAKWQHTHFESQWSQHTFFGSHKVGTYIFWVAQSRAFILVAQSRNILISSRNCRKIPFLVRTKSQHICFGSRKVAHLFRPHKNAIYLFWVAMIATYLLWVAQIRNISFLGRAKSHKNSSVTPSRSIPILKCNGCKISPKLDSGLTLSTEIGYVSTLYWI